MYDKVRFCLEFLFGYDVPIWTILLACVDTGHNLYFVLLDLMHAYTLLIN